MKCDACPVESCVSYAVCGATSVMFQAISQYLPRGDLRLRPAIYEMILHEFLKTDYEVSYTPTRVQSWRDERTTADSACCFFL